MDDMQVPPMQPIQPAGAMPPVGGAPVMNSAQTVVVPRKTSSGLGKTIAIVVLSLVSATFIGLFVWIFMRYTEVSTDVNGQIDLAVAEAKDAQAIELEKDFAEREKEPRRDFAGPADYGQLSFKYPKTWSVYVDKDAVNGGDYEAYFNPLQVDAVDSKAIYALRLSILNKSFDTVVSEYQKKMERKDSELTVQSVEQNGITMNRYTGKIPDTDFMGVTVIFKIRDKTAVLRTDSVNFLSDFDALLQTITFNA